MASGQKRYLLLGLAVLVIVLYILQDHHCPSRLSASTSQGTPPQKPIKGHWSWSDRKPHYPLKSLTPLPTGSPKKLPPVQYRFGRESRSERAIRLERQKTVKDVFQKCWHSYRTRAWMKDELTPISGSGRNPFGGWAATLVDSLDTLWIMDLKDEFEEAAAAAMDIDFTKSTTGSISVFETTIRYLGGFIAAYDLSGDAKLLRKAVEVGEMLLVPFDTPNHFPIGSWDWRKAARGERQKTPNSGNIAELGSFSVEFTRLSQLTGDPRWYDAVNRIIRLFDAQQNKTKLPGMWPVHVNPATEDLISDDSFTLGGQSDSLYEYFPKEFALLGGLEPVYQKLYEQSIPTAAKNLFFRPMTPHGGDYLISGDARAYGPGRGVSLTPQTQHLTCFAGGMLALGGRLFGLDDHLAMAKQLTDGCIWAYKATTVGVMPEIGRFIPCRSSHGHCAWDHDEWKAATMIEYEHTTTQDDSSQTPLDSGRNETVVTGDHVPPGYASIPNAQYILRPEALESVFYMWRVSGDRAYLDHAWDMFSAIQRITETKFGNAAVTDITAKDEDGLPPKSDSMQSFWTAETLKYAYLIFSEPTLISLDDYVFSTEAHPVRRPI